ncbi:MAG: TlpA family protein disulfide reductase [Rhodobacteraceae bacterium]|nr:TlpA family protein disulfide reductase [Paracoccaceae bacterium]
MDKLKRTSRVLWSGFVRSLVLILCISLTLQSCKESNDATASKSLAPDFTIDLLGSDDSFRLSDFRGNPVVINFFASWCTTCGIEAGDLEKAYREFVPMDVVFVGVAIDDTLSKALEYLEKNGISYSAGLDESGAIKEAYGLHGLPYTFFVDKEGYISYVHAGAVPGLLLKHELEKLL